MSRCLRTAMLATTAFATLTLPAAAQTLDQLLQTPNQATSPSLATLLPNGGAPVASVANVLGYGRTFGFGSSSTDTRNNASAVLPGYGDRYSNGNAIYLELLSPLIGATNRSGSLIPLATPAPTNFAAAGTTSLTAIPQTAAFQSIYGRFNSNDIAVMFSGINDWSGGNVTAANYQAIAASNIANQTTMASQLIAAGARNLVVLGQAPFGTFQYFTIPRANGIGGDGNAINAGTQIVEQGLEANLSALHYQTGANIHLLDTGLFINQIRANPTAYGFTAAGVQPGVNCFSLLGITTASCPANASFAVQNQFLSWDGIHYTYRFHSELAQVIANQLVAPATIAPQASILGSTSSAFSTNLLLRLDAYRSQTLSQGTAGPQAAVRPFSVFVEGGYQNADRDSHSGGVGYGNDQGSLTVGAEYRPAPGIVLGGAFNYASPSVRLNNLGEAGNTRIDLNAYQIAGFASLARPNYYIDGVVGYGFDDLHTRRDGIVSQLSANPGGNTFFAAAKGAYLFDTGVVQIGPLTSLSYNKVWIDGYSEHGDALLNQSVSGQSTDSLVGSAGIQLRKPVTLAGLAVNPFLNLTAEREFLAGRRSLVTAQTYALDLPTTTIVRGYGGGTYGKVAGGASVELGYGFSAMVNAAATFARNNGNDYQVNGGVKYSF